MQSVMLLGILARYHEPCLHFLRLAFVGVDNRDSGSLFQRRHIFTLFQDFYLVSLSAIVLDIGLGAQHEERRLCIDCQISRKLHVGR